MEDPMTQGPKDEFDYKYDILVNEMNTISSIITKYDDILFKIHGWSITIFSLLIGYGIQNKSFVVTLLPVAPTIFFWIFHAIYKGFQRRFIVRYNRIEHYFRSNQFSDDLCTRQLSRIVLPDISGSHSVKNLRQKVSPVRGFFLIHNAFVYLAMISLSICFSGLVYLGLL